MDLTLNNPKWLICYKAKPNQTKPILYEWRNSDTTVVAKRE